MIAISWMFGIALGTPGAFGVGSTYVRSQLGYCVSIVLSPLGSGLMTFQSYGANTLIGIIYIFLLYKLMTSGRVMPGTVMTIRRQNILKRRIAIARLLILSFVWRCVCDLPMVVALSGFPSDYVKQPLLHLWLRFCIFMQYAVNPVRMCVYVCLKCTVLTLDRRE